MRVGVVFPQVEAGTDPGALRDFVQTVEGLGFSHLTLFDHVVGAHQSRLTHLPGAPYNLDTPFHEPFAFLAFCAAITRRIELCTGVLILPQRQTVLVAKQAAEVDILSGGRMNLGVGIGWNDLEYRSLGMDFHTRGKRLAEQVKVMRMLWTQPMVEFEGEFHSLNGVGLNPLPVQRPIPIWFGGSSPRTIERMAELGDGWTWSGSPIMSGKVDVARTIATVHARMQALGRDPQTFHFDGRIKLEQGDGTPKWLLGQYLRWQQLGATQIGINTMEMGLPDLKAHAKVLADVAKVLSDGQAWPTPLVEGGDDSL